MTISNPITPLRESWLEVQAVLRRWPWVDLLCGLALAAFGSLATLYPAQILHHSPFHAIAPFIAFFGPACWMSGASQMGAGVVKFLRPRLIRPQIRFVIATLALWSYVVIVLSVDSVTGKIAWGVLTLQELLIWLAIVA